MSTHACISKPGMFFYYFSNDLYLFLFVFFTLLLKTLPRKPVHRDVLSKVGFYDFNNIMLSFLFAGGFRVITFLWSTWLSHQLQATETERSFLRIWPGLMLPQNYFNAQLVSNLSFHSVLALTVPSLLPALPSFALEVFIFDGWLIWKTQVML